MELIGADSDYIGRGFSYFTVETHIRHLDEIVSGEIVRVVTQVLRGEGKSIHLFHRLQTAYGRVAATGEHLLVHVDLGSRSACAPEPAVAQRLADLAAAHAGIEQPDGVGRYVGQR